MKGQKNLWDKKMKLILGEKGMKQAGDLFIYLLHICHGAPAEKNSLSPRDLP